jgi:hypothetical protein
VRRVVAHQGADGRVGQIAHRWSGSQGGTSLKRSQHGRSESERRQGRRRAATLWTRGALGAGVGAFVLALVAASRAEARDEARMAREVESASRAVAPAARSATIMQDTLAGRSRKLRARFLAPAHAVTFPFLRRLLGDSVERPGVHEVAVGSAPHAPRRPFAFITLVPFHEKIAGRIGSYRVGFWPGELGRALAGKYANPRGFIRVTPDNQLTYVSEHFRLRDFLTHDQVRVWPKYLVLDEALVDKLELVIDTLRAQGYDVRRLHVMSGFRTPQYNAGGGDPRGRADLSRHQYGDAADVWVENGAGRMADLNRDGRIDTQDAAIVADAAERVERAHPELVGGIGIYRANSAHGPFVHIDTRGTRARWGHG